MLPESLLGVGWEVVTADLGWAGWPRGGAGSPWEEGEGPAADRALGGHQQVRMRLLTLAQVEQPHQRCSGVCEGLGTRAGPPPWPVLTAPTPQGVPRAPSSDEECFFDLLSKFQRSRMDDQRCPLEEGQPGAAEATAAPALEERVGESPGAPDLDLEGCGAGSTPPIHCSTLELPKGGTHPPQSAPCHRGLPPPPRPQLHPGEPAALRLPAGTQGVRGITAWGCGGRGGRGGRGGARSTTSREPPGGGGGASEGPCVDPAGPPPRERRRLTRCPHSPALADSLPPDGRALRPHRQLPEPTAGRPAGQRGQPPRAAHHPQQPGAPARRRGPPGAGGRVLQHAHQVPGGPAARRRGGPGPLRLAWQVPCGDREDRPARPVSLTKGPGGRGAGPPDKATPGFLRSTVRTKLRVARSPRPWSRGSPQPSTQDGENQGPGSTLVLGEGLGQQAGGAGGGAQQACVWKPGSTQTCRPSPQRTGRRGPRWAQGAPKPALSKNPRAPRPHARRLLALLLQTLRRSPHPSAPPAQQRRPRPRRGPRGPPGTSGSGSCSPLPCPKGS